MKPLQDLLDTEKGLVIAINSREGYLNEKISQLSNPKWADITSFIQKQIDEMREELDNLFNELVSCRKNIAEYFKCVNSL